MPDNSKIEQVKELLSNGNTEAAADLLLELSKKADKAHYHAALLVKNRVETLQHRVIEGVLSQSEERVEWARVSKGIMELVSQIERGERPQAEEEIIPREGKKEKKAGVRIWLLALPVALVLGVFVVPKMLNQPTSEKTSTKKPATENSTADLPKSKLISLPGRVTTYDEKDVPGAEVIFEGYGKTVRAKTNQHGRFEITIPESMLNKQVDLTIVKNGKKSPDKQSIRFGKSLLQRLKYGQ